MRVFAVDPGYEESAVVIIDATSLRIIDSLMLKNNELLDNIRLQGFSDINIDSDDRLVIEAMTSYGQRVGIETIGTIYWSGRFHQAWVDHYGNGVRQVTRVAVKTHLCGVARASDSDIRTVLHDRYGGKAKAKGTKREPGPMHFITGHGYAALALGFTWIETETPEVN